MFDVLTIILLLTGINFLFMENQWWYLPYKQNDSALIPWHT